MWVVISPAPCYRAVSGPTWMLLHTKKAIYNTYNDLNGCCLKVCLILSNQQALLTVFKYWKRVKRLTGSTNLCFFFWVKAKPVKNRSQQISLLLGGINVLLNVEDKINNFHCLDQWKSPGPTHRRPSGWPFHKGRFLIHIWATPLLISSYYTVLLCTLVNCVISISNMLCLPLNEYFASSLLV